MNNADACNSKDLAIKLFGKTIPVPESRFAAKSEENSCLGRQIPYKAEPMFQNMCCEISKTETMDKQLEVSGFICKSGEDNDSQLTGDGSGAQINIKPVEDSAETSSSTVDETEKVLKKPDKVLVCPRCNSLDTKFCYFNNYNVNQPRHFCKHCNRYWTAGGTVRNVPVGAGRRKNKHLAPQYRRESLVFTDKVPVNSVEKPNSTLNRGTVVNFGSEGHFCESVRGKIREDTPLCGSSITASDTNANAIQIPQEVKELGSESNPMHCYPIPPWVLVSAPDDGNQNPIRWSPTPMLAVPPAIPLNLVPASYWSFFPIWTEGTRHSLALGKHSRDGNFTHEKSDECVSVPKMLRIDDPDEVCKSSTVATLGLNSNQEENKLRCSVFKPYKSSQGYKGQPLDTKEVLEANPAALSRAHKFQESA